MNFFRPLNQTDVLDTSQVTLDRGIYASETKDGPVKRNDIILEDPARSKKLYIAVYWPASSASEKLPVLIFSHGVLSDCNAYAFLGLRLAGQGYVVLMNTHGDSMYLNGGLAVLMRKGGMEQEVSRCVSDTKLWIDRCLDVHFLIDQLEQIHKSIPGIGKLFDTSRVGVFGHSYGAQTCMALAGTVLTDTDGKALPPLQHPKVACVALLSPAGVCPPFGLANSSAWSKVSAPILAITGTADSSLVGSDPVERLSFLQHIPSEIPRYSALIDACDHGFGGISGLNASRFLEYKIAPLHGELVRVLLVAFFDAHLRNQPEAIRFLQSKESRQLFGKAMNFQYLAIASDDDAEKCTAS